MPSELPTADKRAWRINDFCAAYSLSRSTIYKLIEHGELRTVLVGGRRLIPQEAVDELFSGRNETRPRLKGHRTYTDSVGAR